jgi:diguanylate cyclase (GGDEF)-like protein
MGASALDRLYRQEEWPWDDDVAHLDCTPEADPACGTFHAKANFPQTALLHDATFLNAILPFALNQARRHREPLALVCVSIDRLGAIRNLLGHAALDALVRKVAETVASLIRTSDIVARLDDDRVVAVLPRAPGGAALDVAKSVSAN